MSDVRTVLLWRDSYACAADDVFAPHPLTLTTDVDTATVETIVNCIREADYLCWGKRWTLRAYDQYGTELAKLMRPWQSPKYVVDKYSLLKTIVWPDATPALYLSNDG